MSVDASDPVICSKRMRIDMMHAERVPSEPAATEDRSISQRLFGIVLRGQFSNFDSPDGLSVPLRAVLRIAEQSTLVFENTSRRSRDARIGGYDGATRMFRPRSSDVTRVIEAQGLVGARIGGGEHPPSAAI